MIRAAPRFRHRARLSGRQPVRRRAHGRRRASAAMAAARWRRAPTSTCCSCCPTSRPPGARASPNTCSICCGISASRSATPRATSIECIAPGALRHDHPHRDARGALILRRRAAVRRASSSASQARCVPGTGAPIHRRQARRARRAPPPAPAPALPGRAQRQGRQGRPARPAHAVLDRQVFLSRQGRAPSWSKAGVFTRRRIPRCSAAAEDFLWAVRCHLHFLTGRAEERLTFDVQPRAWPRGSAIPAAPACSAVERFMKHYFLVAKDVGDLTAHLLRGARVRAAEAARRARPLARAVQPAPPRQARRTTDFVIDNGRIYIANQEVFAERPGQPHPPVLAGRPAIWLFHPEALQPVARSLRLIDDDLRDDPSANRLFLEASDRSRRSGSDAAQDERGRRARPLHPGFRQHRRR